MLRKASNITRSKSRGKTAESGAVQVPAPGEGKRGEQGYLGYLLRQAHAAVRLTMERTLADLGVTSPQFAVLTMLNASGRRARRQGRGEHSPLARQRRDGVAGGLVS